MKIDTNRYQKTDLLIHKAAQVIAFLGKSLAKERADDSHATFIYDLEKNALIGKKLKIKKKKFTAALHFSDFALHLKNKDEILIFFLEGKTNAEIIVKVKKRLSAKKLGSFNLHYELPEDYDLEQYKMIRPTQEALQEWGSVRDLAAQVFEKVNEIIAIPSAINIWPHHFDTGTYHVLAKDEKGAAASVGTGFAMADLVASAPYFYIYGWVRDKEIDFSKAPSLPCGEWKTGDWKGAVVSLEAISRMAEPQKELAVFFETTFQFFKSQL